MKGIGKITAILIILVAVLLGAAGCSPSISQEEYDTVKNELNSVELQVEALQGKLDEAAKLREQYDQLNTQYQNLKKLCEAQVGENQTIETGYDELLVSYEQLKRQYEAKIDEMQAIYDEYDVLSQEYEELKKQYDDIVQAKAPFTEEEIDQALFALINQERRNAGLDELEWGQNLYWWASRNSLEMSEKGDFKYSSWQSQQAVLITAGHSTLEGIVNGTLAVWKQRKPEYDIKFINSSLHYGAVATYKSGDVYYITYMAATYP